MSCDPGGVPEAEGKADPHTICSLTEVRHVEEEPEEELTRGFWRERRSECPEEVGWSALKGWRGGGGLRKGLEFFLQKDALRRHQVRIWREWPGFKHLTWELKARVPNGTQAACPALSTERHPRGQPDLAHGHSACRAPVLTEWQGKTMSMGQTFCKKTYKNK